MLASKSEKLIALTALWNLDPILVGPLLDLRVAPRIKERIRQALGSSGGGRGSSSGVSSEVVGGDTTVAADGGDDLVAGRWLRYWDATLVAPCLQVRFGPGAVKPFARVSSSLASLGRNGIVVVTSGS